MALVTVVMAGHAQRSCPAGRPSHGNTPHAPKHTHTQRHTSREANGNTPTHTQTNTPRHTPSGTPVGFPFLVANRAVAHPSRQKGCSREPGSA